MRFCELCIPAHDAIDEVKVSDLPPIACIHLGNESQLPYCRISESVGVRGGALIRLLHSLRPFHSLHSFHSCHSLHSPCTLPVIPFVYRGSDEWREWREWRARRKWREWHKWCDWRGRLNSSVRCLCGSYKDLSLRFRFYGSTVGAYTGPTYPTPNQAYIYIYTYIYIHMYTYIYRERESKHTT